MVACRWMHSSCLVSATIIAIGAMISFRKPSAQLITAFLMSQSKLDFSYAAVGATTNPPSGYDVDHTRIKLGEGREIFLHGKAALRRSAHFRLGWLEARSDEPSFRVGGRSRFMPKQWDCGGPMRAGSSTSSIKRALSNNTESRTDTTRPYGERRRTFPDRMESGRQLRLVYILAFSRPHGFLAKVANRNLRFRRGSEETRARRW